MDGMAKQQVNPELSNEPSFLTPRIPMQPGEHCRLSPKPLPFAAALTVASP